MHQEAMIALKEKFKEREAQFKLSETYRATIESYLGKLLLFSVFRAHKLGDSQVKNILRTL